MKRLLVVSIALALFGCAQLGALNPFGAAGTGGPAQAFGVAKAAYIAAFDSAARYLVLCQAQPPTLRCDELGELVLDKVNPMARQHIGLGEGILAGLVTEQMACDEVTKPGCTEANRLKQLETLAVALQQAAVMLNSRR